MKRFVCIFLIGSFILTSLLVQIIPQASAEDLPKMIAITSYPVGSFAYIATSGFREAIEQNTPMKARVEPYGNDPSRIIPLKNKESEITMLTGATGVCVSHGKGDFSKKEWGPQPIRQVWRGNEIYMSMITRGDSDIYYPKDLKGKRVPFIPGFAAGNLTVESFLAFANLTWDDVEKVPVGGFIDQVKAVQEGITDAGYAGTITATVQEIASGPHGLRWVQVPSQDKEGWKRLQEVSPWELPALVKDPPGMKGSVEMYTYPYGLWCWDNASEDVIYHIVKAMHKGYDSFKDMHSILKSWTIEQAVKNPTPVPYHEGAIRYFKEAGVWTADMDKWQQEQLDAFNKRQAAFLKRIGK